MRDDAAAGSHDSPVERRLATILMADVYGYSRMMGEDEERTVRVLRGHRAVFDEFLKAHRGRVFNTAGDAILAEFPSAVEAVRCATEIQAALRTRNEHLPEQERMWFRIGVNLGDVIVQEGDLLGDGVNVAARIQTVAEPGGICISGSVYDQIQNKLSLQFRQLGERSFKNIAQPVRTFSIAEEGATAPRVSRERRGFPGIAAMALALLLLAISAAGYWLYRENETRTAEARRAEQAQRAADAQRKAEQDSAAAQREAKLQADLESAKSALAQAEASKRKAEMDRASAELAQREARVQADLKAAKDAMQKAAESEKKAEQDRIAAAAAVKNSDNGGARKRGEAASARKDAEAAATSDTTAVAAVTPKPATTTGARAIDRLDGSYAGRMCSVNPDGSPRCWPVALLVQHGQLSATWTSRSNKPSHAAGAIAADGTVSLTLDGFNLRGNPMIAETRGTLAGDKITVSGNWSNGTPVNAIWSISR
jgi:class 3 adenylate cyclase